MISVILPAYNAQETIGEAIQSIIDQTYTDWELLVINDGSTDNTRSVVLSFADSRIRYIENEGNKKLIYTLNRGLELATGKYIVRMDADDISLPTRFEKQVAFMDNHLDVVASGGGMLTFSNDKIIKRIHCESDSEKIELLLFNTSPIYHPTAIIRRSILELYAIRYSQEYLHVEDYMLWYNLSKVGKLSNIDDVLIKYRISDNQVSSKYSDLQINNKNKVRKQIVFDFLQSIGLLFNINSYEDFLNKFVEHVESLKQEGTEKNKIIEVLFIMYMSSHKSVKQIWHYYKFFNRFYKFPLKYKLIFLLSNLGMSKRWGSYALG
jgi:glycosyltransferase involved in cell wall biosynthesis